MLGLRRSGKRRKNRNQPRHPSDLHRKEREAKHVDRMVDDANEDSSHASNPPAATVYEERRRVSEDVERPRSEERRRNYPR